MEKSISIFNHKLYISDILNLSLNFPYVHIIGIHHCIKEQCEAFKCRGSYQDVLFCLDYDELLVETFANQNQHKYMEAVFMSLLK